MGRRRVGRMNQQTTNGEPPETTAEAATTPTPPRPSPTAQPETQPLVNPSVSRAQQSQAKPIADRPTDRRSPMGVSQCDFQKGRNAHSREPRGRMSNAVCTIGTAHKREHAHTHAHTEASR